MDIDKLAVVPHELTYFFDFNFMKSLAANCSYRVENNDSQVLLKRDLVYPQNGEQPSIDQMGQKIRSFLVPVGFVGMIQYEKLMSDKTLSVILSDYIRLPTPSSDKYLQFKKEELLNTTIVVTDKAEDKVMYRIVIPSDKYDPSTYTSMVDDFKTKLRAAGQTDAQIALLMPGYLKVVESVKAQDQLLIKRKRPAQFETYTYEP